MLNVDDKVLIRGVTLYHVGRVAEIDKTWVRLEDASWVADTGRLSVALETGTLNEVERMPDGCVIARASIVDVIPWTHELPVATR